MIHSRVVWMSAPVERSMIVSAPQRVAHTIFSTSSEIELRTAELPMFALTFTAKFLPMIIGSDSGWRWLAGMTARPMATSDRTRSASTPSRAAMNRISSVMMPARAQASWVLAPSIGSGRCQLSRVGVRPFSTSMCAAVSV